MTKTITINGKEFPVKVTGTVGLVQYAQHLMAAAGITEPSAQMQNMATFYAALLATNEDRDDLPTFMQFMTHWTSKELLEFSKWFWDEWQILEGPIEEPKPEETADTKND